MQHDSNLVEKGTARENNELVASALALREGSLELLVERAF
jgi:hypothetical protein